MPMNRSAFPDVFSSSAALAFLRQIIKDGMSKGRPEWFPEIFNMETTDQPHEQYTSVAYFGTPVETDEGSSTTYDSALQGFDTTITPVQYSLGFRVTKIAMDDDRKGIFTDQASQLGWSFKEGRNILAADLFNNGFNSSFTGADGVELFSTAHVHEDGTTFNNELDTAADFSITSLRTALIDFRDFRDGRGKRLNLMPKYIMSSSNNYFDIAEVLQSTMRPDTANNADNVTRNFFGQGPNFTQVLNDYLTDTDAWFLIGPKEDHGLICLDRETLTVENDRDFETRTLKTAAWARYQMDWFGNGKGLMASPGA